MVIRLFKSVNNYKNNSIGKSRLISSTERHVQVPFTQNLRGNANCALNKKKGQRGFLLDQIVLIS